MIKFFRLHWAEILLGILVLIYAAVFSSLSIVRHLSFFSSYDLANTDQTIWNSLHGHIFQLSGLNGSVSRFSFHADLILILLAPIYLIYDHVATLLTLQSIFIGLAAVPVYLLAKKMLHSSLIALILATVFLLNPGVEWTNLYDFHAVSMAMFFLLSAFYCAQTSKWNLMYLFSFLAILTKENVALAVMMLGIYVFFVLKEKAKGKILFLGGILWFLLMIFFFIPRFSDTGRYWVWDWFDKNKYEAPITGGFDFSKVVWKFTNSQSVGYLKDLLKPLAYFPIIGLPWFLIALPDLTINLLSDQAQMKTIIFHYDSIVVVGLILSTIYGLKLVSKFTKNNKWVVYSIAALILATTIRTNYHYSPLPTTPSYWRPMYEYTQDEKDFERALGSIPKNAVISASSEARSHLTHRFEAYNLPNIPVNTEYIAIVEQSRAVGDTSLKSFEQDLIKKLDLQAELLFHEGFFYLYKIDKPLKL